MSDTPVESRRPLVTADTSLPLWLDDLRRAEVLDPIENDSRTGQDRPLGVDQQAVFEICGGGQADFDESWNDLSSDDRCLLYARSFQRGHLQELLAAFRLLFRDSAPESPVVIDLGCGPFTGGLAMAATLDPCRFHYVGVDRSAAMRRLGHRLADTVRTYHPDAVISHRWVADATEDAWDLAPSWRPILVIVSYLLASPTLDLVVLIEGLNKLLLRIGRGPAMVLYTNSPRPKANQRLPEFRDALEDCQFEQKTEDDAVLPADRDSGYPYERRLRYALFYRSELTTLSLD
ncbi:MAG: hypothetical protein OXC19_12780 [Bryobacterales bacterium]|nr:hypothetical protein [Bryobacterales bacterium]